MGTVYHNAVIVTFDAYVLDTAYAPDIEGFRASLPSRWQPLVVGPIHSVINSEITYFFAPDGGKTGWDHDQDGERYRKQFIALFALRYEDDSGPFDVVEITYGADHRIDFEQPVARYAEIGDGQ